MAEKALTERVIEKFLLRLYNEEKSENTVKKYLRDARAFAEFLDGGAVTAMAAVRYKNELITKGYAAMSINSILASLNSLFDFLGLSDCRLKYVRAQKEVYRSEERELSKSEYISLLKAARTKKDRRLTVLIQTICATGIRVSELKYITVEAAKNGEAVVRLKGKTRSILIIPKLQKMLLELAKSQGIKSGAIFINRKGKAISRTSVWRMMKGLSNAAQISSKKVFPHNLRRLFSRVYYEKKRDIAKLADILGHSSINTTRIYIMSTGAEHRRHMESLNLLL